MTLGRRKLKNELIKVRQSPDYPALRPMMRRTIKYIERLEKRLSTLEGNRPLTGSAN
jgi:hypothetical protein